MVQTDTCQSAIVDHDSPVVDHSYRLKHYLDLTKQPISCLLTRDTLQFKYFIEFLL